jgi:hypothetical protein
VGPGREMVAEALRFNTLSILFVINAGRVKCYKLCEEESG